MITVTEALDKIIALMPPMPIEIVSLAEANGRVLGQDVLASRDQPPFAASSMDGYAVGQADARPGASLEVVGEAAAGGHFPGHVKPGQAVRIFTGASVPAGADQVIIQEDTQRVENVITLAKTLGAGPNIRPSGYDFKAGMRLAAPRRLRPSDIALLASMNQANLPVRRKPVVALISTGDELVMPGETPGPDQIISSNGFGLAALLQDFGADTRLLPIARDHVASLQMALKLASGADLIVTIGGASVGDHDIVRDVATDMGMEPAFYKVAMRPGKPLMAGMLDDTPVIGLPGNPVSAMVCGHIFIRPALNAMLGLPAHPLSRELARLGQALPKNGDREHYMRASLAIEYGQLTAHPAERQDSALLTVLANATGFLVRPPHDPAKSVGDMVEVIRL